MIMRTFSVRSGHVVEAALLALALLAEARPCRAQTPPSPAPTAAPSPAPKPGEGIKLGATIFADFTLQDAPRVTDSDRSAVRKSEFEVRRAYLNLSGNVSDFFSFRVTPDVAARQTTTVSGLPADARVSSSLDGSLTIRLKYAFAQCAFDKFGGAGKSAWIRLGQQQTPYLDFMEGIYRYRFQGTLFVERQGLLSSSDVGFSGHMNLPREYGDVHVGAYNGDTYTRAEANGQKAVQARVSLRPLPRHVLLKGLRVHTFVDRDSPVAGGARNRTTADLTFEHRHLNLGVDYVWAADRASGRPSTTEVRSTGWSAWVNPRLGTGLEGLFRYDRYTPNRAVAGRKREVIAGVACWFRVLRAPQAVAVVADYDGVDYDAVLARPAERRWELKALLSF